ncbi:MAG TPA: M24 family metallopeptidase, partial [Myxococcota bacterium]
VVLSAQKAALDQCKPGSTLPQVHDAAVRAIVEGLVDLSLLEGDAAELVAREAHRPYYMHSTSHWLGLDVHDVGSYQVDGQPRKLESGLVFTVEPGVYIAPDAENAAPDFRGIGVRIEDNVVITAESHENLTAAVPKQPDDLEALVREGAARARAD